jgi:hypothetical protein
MRAMNLKDKIGKIFVVFALLFGIGIATNITAQAQWGNDRYEQDRRYEREQRQREREQRRRERDYRRNRRGNNGYGNGRYNDGYSDYGGSFDLRQTALNAGANEGNKAGRKDRSRGERYDFTDESEYQRATKDYSSRLGDRETYRRYFREAFQNGYADGYAGY